MDASKKPAQKRSPKTPETKQEKLQRLNENIKKLKLQQKLIDVDIQRLEIELDFESQS